MDFPRILALSYCNPMQTMTAAATIFHFFLQVNSLCLTHFNYSTPNNFYECGIIIPKLQPQIGGPRYLGLLREARLLTLQANADSDVEITCMRE
jgi:hypothetical protein